MTTTTSKALSRSTLESMGFDLEGITEDVSLLDTVARTRSTRFRAGEPALQRVIYEWVPAPSDATEAMKRSGVDEWSKQIAATITLQPGARLNSISQKIQEKQSDGTEMWVVNGVLYNVGFDIMLETPSGPRTLVELLMDITNATTGSEMDLDSFVAFCHKYGFRPDGRMFMQFQHMNADETKTDEVFDTLGKLGMVDRLDELDDPKSIQRRIGFTGDGQPGLDVVEMAIGGFNRNLSKTQTGFIDVVCATVENYWLWRQLRTEARMLHEATAHSEKPLSDKKVKENLTRVKEIENLSRRWINSWGGRHQVMEPSPVGEGLIPTDTIYADNASIGNLVVVDPESGTEHSLDFWKPIEDDAAAPAKSAAAKKASRAAKKATPVDTTTDASPFGQGDAEPF